MKAYVLNDTKKIVIEERQIPILAEDEVLIKVSYLGLCGSDIHLYNGTYNGPFCYPMLFGHEWSGIIKKRGNKVTKVNIGDKVTGDCSKFCNECDKCKIDKNLCDNIEKFGITIDGASAEYIIRKAKYIYKAPKDLDLDLIALVEPIAVSAHLISKIVDIVKEIKDKKILIYGGGPIGISALLILKNYYNCKNVDVYDIIEGRIELAKKSGANIPNPNQLNAEVDENQYDSIYSMAKYDVVIETTGNPKVFENTFNLVKPLGIIGCLGMMSQVNINQKMIVVKGLKIIGSIGGTGEFPKVLDFIKDNKGKVSNLISHIINVNEIEKAFEISKNTKKSMKILIKMK